MEKLVGMFYEFVPISFFIPRLPHTLRGDFDQNGCSLRDDSIRPYRKEGFAIRESTMRHLDHLKNMVIMASADGSLTEREIALLVDRCADLGLEEADLGKAVQFALSDEASLKLPTDREEQLAMLGDLMRIMAADGHLTEVEKRLFALAAAKMNVDREELDHLIDNLLGKDKD